MEPTRTPSARLLFGLTDAKRRSIRRWMFIGMGLLMLGGIAIGFIPYYAVSREMQSFCASLAVGSPLAAARSEAMARGYEVSTTTGGHLLLKIPRLAPQLPSKRGCELRVAPTGVLVSVTYSDSL